MSLFKSRMDQNSTHSDWMGFLIFSVSDYFLMSSMEAYITRTKRLCKKSQKTDRKKEAGSSGDVNVFGYNISHGLIIY